jgi:hypothetical protein
MARLNHSYSLAIFKLIITFRSGPLIVSWVKRGFPSWHYLGWLVMLLEWPAVD